MELSVIISTYKSPLWLQKVLTGYCQQTFRSFEIIIAEDASDFETAQVLRFFSERLVIKHISQPDSGFRKNVALNKAILASEAPYLVFTDGDCIPRKDFLETHVAKRKNNHFLSGGYFKLSMNISRSITADDINNESCFDLTWLKSKGIRSSIKNLKLSRQKSISTLLNRMTTAKATWNGHNSSGWKSDILSVNGFNEEMGYGGEDRELGERLMNNGIRGIQIRYSAICVHLDHAREYVTENAYVENSIIRSETKRCQMVWTQMGINKY